MVWSKIAQLHKPLECYENDVRLLYSTFYIKSTQCWDCVPNKFSGIQEYLDTVNQSHKSVMECYPESVDIKLKLIFATFYEFYKITVGTTRCSKDSPTKMWRVILCSLSEWLFYILWALMPTDDPHQNTYKHNLDYMYSKSLELIGYMRYFWSSGAFSVYHHKMAPFVPPTLKRHL